MHAVSLKIDALPFPPTNAAALLLEFFPFLFILDVFGFFFWGGADNGRDAA